MSLEHQQRTARYPHQFFAEYTYGGHDGVEYTGEAAFVLNSLDSAEAALTGTLGGMKPGAPTDDVTRAYAMRDRLRRVLANPELLARLI